MLFFIAFFSLTVTHSMERESQKQGGQEDEQCPGEYRYSTISNFPVFCNALTAEEWKTANVACTAPCDKNCSDYSNLRGQPIYRLLDYTAKYTENNTTKFNVVYNKYQDDNGNLILNKMCAPLSSFDSLLTFAKTLMSKDVKQIFKVEEQNDGTYSKMFNLVDAAYIKDTPVLSY